MLEFKGAIKRFGPLTVIDGLDLKFPESGVVAILGTSGSGKTTMLRVIAGLEKLDSGELLIPQGARISMVFQEDRLIPGLSAAENILAVLPPDPNNTAKTEKILAACGLSQAAHKLPDQLSGGMQRRVAIGRALAFGGDILLLDEPFKGLDPATREDVIRIVLSEREQGLTLLVTHSMEEAERCADSILKFEGPPLRVAEALGR
ncbi:MAG: ATP-binding cassette domain-containing protein [Oscillospiraceae bacterium]|nr:ATP-binding cassette domain-containing protein [Oscillospiraceae bacterium]